jgi:RimJ/RimL family protein N-acetyltransferase
MNELFTILQRNQGQVLTPELISGVMNSYEFTRHGAVDSMIPTREMAPPNYDGPFLVANDRERVAEWVRKRIGMLGEWGSYAAIGQEDAEGNLVVGMVLEGMTATNAFMHVAISDKAKLHKSMVRACFDYAFNQLDLERVTGLVDADNEAALRFDQHLGFEHEFTIPNGNGGDVIQLVLWRDRCRWIKRTH